MKSDKRKKALTEKKARKASRMHADGGSSAYAEKKNAQRNGHYRPTSPFYVPGEDHGS